MMAKVNSGAAARAPNAEDTVGVPGCLLGRGTGRGRPACAGRPCVPANPDMSCCLRPSFAPNFIIVWVNNIVTITNAISIIIIHVFVQLSFIIFVTLTDFYDTFFAPQHFWPTTVKKCVTRTNSLYTLFSFFFNFVTRYRIRFFIHEILRSTTCREQNHN